jgi:uncharacterized protein
MAADDKVVVGLTHGLDDPERVLLAYLMGVEAVRKDKQVVMWLTQDAVHVVTPGFAEQVKVPDAPAVADLHAEYIDKGGRFQACPVCVRSRGLTDAPMVANAEVNGAAALYEFTEGGALTFNY